ncbi:hypothetical protein EUGRSUZ_J02360 [Eucalyptus grandis]|uniref:Uncharacterized protein n=2 Tax=Eucalyptus grandis TaxID=71139 RepID=A0A059AI52_EUCGR|nr:hypothetical protein EUGRSUZ_J02360 [Eucalyptus grandis]
MANYLNFDIYDLELSGLRRNAELRKLLVATANHSILVVEDIDCTIELQDRKSETRAARMNMMSTDYPREDVQFYFIFFFLAFIFGTRFTSLTLSGFLNFIDGLWSSCGDEQIIIFTTNHKEKLDSALLRPGRMDVHVHTSYCTPCGFRLLASNYLGIDHHELFDQIKSSITGIDHHELFDQIESSITAARVTPAEDLVSFLADHKRKETEEVIKEKVCQCQLVEENGGTEEESDKCKIIEE